MITRARQWYDWTIEMDVIGEIRRDLIIECVLGGYLIFSYCPAPPASCMLLIDIDNGYIAMICNFVFGNSGSSLRFHQISSNFLKDDVYRWKHIQSLIAKETVAKKFSHYCLSADGLAPLGARPSLGTVVAALIYVQDQHVMVKTSLAIIRTLC